MPPTTASVPDGRPGPVRWLVTAAVLGARLGVVVDPAQTAGAAAALGGMVGLGWWVLGPLTLQPVLVASRPNWSFEDASASFPSSSERSSTAG